MLKLYKYTLVPSLIVLWSAASLAGQTPVRDRILRRAESRSTFVVKGNVHPFARQDNDRGKVDDSFPVARITIMFKSTAEQDAALNALLEQQQDPMSSGFHKWLAPEDFAARFGLSANDVQEVVSWLQVQGFTIDQVGQTRRFVTFSGSARQVQTAFQTAVHQYVVNGETFYANTSDPAIPSAFADVVSGFRALNNFRLKPRPRFTSSVTGRHFLSPADFATIYNLNSLYASGLDGRGQKIAIMGQTDIDLNDIRAFRSNSGLPASDPQVILVPGSADPGTNSGDLGEADLDIEWSGAVARNAQIIYVNSNNGAFDSLQYAIDQNVAPVISISYGACEKNISAQDVSLLAALGQQANAQGITILAASGDQGAADCESSSSQTATTGLAVDIPAALPYVTGVGGSEFQEVTNSWATANDAVSGSALSYIPEMAWNDSSTQGRIAAGGGGRSSIFSKPSWQTGAGVPNDNARDVPDISMNASPAHDGYLVCSLQSCVNGFRDASGNLTVVGGTSAGAPGFAGIVALINQRSNSPQGNINPTLYRLAAVSPLVFHDITSGSNQVRCSAGSTGCPSAGSIGYNAGPGYDTVTGLGSVDAAALVSAWPSPAAGSNLTTTTTTTTTTTNATGIPTTPPQPIADVEQGAIRSGYAVITPDANSSTPSATATFGMVSGGAVQSQAGILPLPIMSDASLFVEVIPGIGRNLGVALANPQAAACSVTLTLRSESGSVSGAPVTLTMQPLQQLAKFISEMFSTAVIGAGFRGSLEVQSSLPIAVLGLRFSGAEFSTLPVDGASASTGLPARTVSGGTVGGAGAIIFPQFAMSGGWATQIALVNRSTIAVTGRLDVLDTSGNPMAVKLNGAANSTFTYSISPGGTFLFAPRDANGQSPF